MEGSRTEPIRRRVAVAKTVLVISAAAVFGGALALTRQHHSSRPKPRLRPLGVLPGYVATVRKTMGNARVIAPAQGSPSAATHVS